MAPSGERLRRKGRRGVFAGKTVWSMPERFEICIVYKRRYINTLPFLSFFFTPDLLWLYANSVSLPSSISLFVRSSSAWLWAVAVVEISPASVCLFIRTISQRPMQLGSPNLTRNDPLWVLEIQLLWSQKLKSQGHEAQKVSVFRQDAILPFAVYVNNTGVSPL